MKRQGAWYGGCRLTLCSCGGVCRSVTLALQGGQYVKSAGSPCPSPPRPNSSAKSSSHSGSAGLGEGLGNEVDVFFSVPDLRLVLKVHDHHLSPSIGLIALTWISLRCVLCCVCLCVRWCVGSCRSFSRVVVRCRLNSSSRRRCVPLWPP